MHMLGFYKFTKKSITSSYNRDVIIVEKYPYLWAVA